MRVQLRPRHDFSVRISLASIAVRRWAKLPRVCSRSTAQRGRARRATVLALRSGAPSVSPMKQMPRHVQIVSATRLRKASLAVRIAGESIAAVAAASISENLSFLDGLELAPERKVVGQRIIAEIASRLRCLGELGLDYLSLDRPTTTLSGGELQRVRLATPDRFEPGGRALYSRRAEHRPASERQ